MSIHVNVKMPKFHKGQQEILDDTTRFKVLSCGRRWGKTMLACNWLAFGKTGALAGKKVAFCAHKMKSTEDAKRYLKKALFPLLKRSSGFATSITLVNGGQIDFWTLRDLTAGRGNTYYKIVFDEAAFVPHLQTIWEDALMPTLLTSRGEAWFTSTPKGYNYFYELFNKRDPEWKSWRLPTSNNPFVPPEEIESMRRQMPSRTFRQEVEAEFLESESGLVTANMLVYDKTPSNLSTVLGVDLAISQTDTADYTALATVCVDDKTGVTYLKDIIRDKLTFNSIIQLIKNVAEKHKPKHIFIEANAAQGYVAQELLRTTRLPIKKITVVKNKEERFAGLLTRYENKMVVHDSINVPSWFKEELLAFPDDTIHDDGIDAFTIAFNGIQTNKLKRIEYRKVY